MLTKGLTIWTALKPDGSVDWTGYDFMEFNDIGKLVKFSTKASDMDFYTSELFYDPFQRIKRHKRTLWDKSEIIDTIYTYDTFNNVTATKKYYDKDGVLTKEEIHKPNQLKAGYIIGDLSTTHDTFMPITSSGSGIYTYDFTYSNTMNVWGSNAGTIKFKITEDSNWTSLNYGIGSTPVTIDGGDVVLEAHGEEIVVTGLVNGASYKMTLTATDVIISLKIEDQGGETIPTLLPVGYISGDLFETAGVYTALTSSGSGICTHDFTYSNSMSSWGGGFGTLKFKLYEAGDYSSINYGIGSTPLTIGGGDVVLIQDGKDNEIIVTELVDGASYKITATATETTVSVKIEEVQPIIIE